MAYNKNQQKSTDGAGLLFIITIIFLSISVWQTAEGYQLMFGSIKAWVFSLAIGIMMLFLSIQIRKFRLEGRNIIGPLIGYIACAIFCFFGNFNALYSKFNKEELVKKELQIHRQELTATSTKAITKLQSADETFINLKKKVGSSLSKLISQINNQGNMGAGAKANVVLSEIEDILKQQITKLDGSPSQLTSGYTEQINNIVRQLYNSSNQAKADIYISEIEHDRDSVYNVLDESIKPENITKMGQDAIFTAVNVHNSIGERTKNFLGKGVFDFDNAEYKNQEIGKISHTFKSAFNGENTWAAILCMLVAIAIDALVPFVIIVGTKNPNSSNYIRGNNGEKGQTDIDVL